MENSAAKSRRTFVAVSFGPVGASAEKVDALSYVSYIDDRIDKEGEIKFLPIGEKAVKSDDRTFDMAFKDVAHIFGVRGTNPPSVPVILWNDRSRAVFDELIHASEVNYMSYPPRYFLLQKYASRKLWNSAESHTVVEIAKKLKIHIRPCREPDAEHMAAIMRRIEDVSEFPPVVAKAFCAICESVIEDGIIEKKEAIELSSFLQLISERYPEFKRLEGALNSAVQRDLLTRERTPESDRLLEIIVEMLNYFKKFTQDEENGENS